MGLKSASSGIRDEFRVNPCERTEKHYTLFLYSVSITIEEARRGTCELKRNLGQLHRSRGRATFEKKETIRLGLGIIESQTNDNLQARKSQTQPNLTLSGLEAPLH